MKSRRRERNWARCYRAAKRLYPVIFAFSTGRLPSDKDTQLAPLATLTEIIAGEIGLPIPEDSCDE